MVTIFQYLHQLLSDLASTLLHYLLFLSKDNESFNEFYN